MTFHHLIARELEEDIRTLSHEGEHVSTDGGSTTESELPVYTTDQIANQLTTDFWGGATYSFDITTDGFLTVDLSNLEENGQTAARRALEAWSDVTGIEFIERMPAQELPTSTVTEGPDAASGTFTPYSMTVGQDFEGSLSGGPDRDAVAISLSAGQKVTIALDGNFDNGDPLADPYLRLRDANGNVILESDDAYGTNSMISFEAPTSGTYYLQAGSYLDSFEGDYTLSVRDVPNGIDITFQDDDDGAYAQFWTSASTITRATINIDSIWAGGSARTDGYFFQTYIHEIGHALGLGHAGPYNGSATYGNDNSYLNDSWQSSVMSYFHQVENTWLDASFAYVITPQVADIVAVQNLYGVAQVRTGDDTYGLGGMTGTYLDTAILLSNPVSYTVYDTGGTDTFDFSSYMDNQTLDLREEMFSDLAGLSGNIGIARGTVVEIGITGSGDDVLTGNASNNSLQANEGSDYISGGGGHDVLHGESGNDTLQGDGERDLVEGGSGNDRVEGNAGSDLLFGDDMTLQSLIDTFPTWTPPFDVQAQIDSGDVLALWEDILFDVYAIA